MSLYCDLYETQEWRTHAIAAHMTAAVEEYVSRPGTIAYVVRMSDRGDIGLLFCHQDDEDFLTYRGIDGSGTITHEPAANEALWKIANAAFGPLF